MMATSGAAQNQNSMFGGDIYQCDQVENYNGTPYRRTQYWQFADQNALVYDTYVVERIGSETICGRVLVNTAEDYVVERQGLASVMSNLDSYQGRWGASSCYSAMAQNSGSPMLRGTRSPNEEIISRTPTQPISMDQMVRLEDPIASLLGPAYPADQLFPLLVPIPGFRIEPYQPNSAAPGFRITFDLAELNDPTVATQAQAAGVDIPVTATAFHEAQANTLVAFYVQYLQPQGQWILKLGTLRASSGGAVLDLTMQNNTTLYELTMRFTVGNGQMNQVVTYNEPNQTIEVQEKLLARPGTVEQINEIVSGWSNVTEQSTGNQGERIYVLSNRTMDTLAGRTAILEVVTTSDNGLTYTYEEFIQPPGDCTSDGLLADWVMVR